MVTFVWIVCILLSLWALHDFGNYQSACLQCGGKGAHRDDCPLKEEE